MTTGMDLRQCAAIVNDFCNHYGIFPKMPKWKLFLVMLPISIQLAVTLAFFIILMNQVHYNKTLLLVFWIVILLPNIINLALLPSRNRKTRRMAADAREKMGGLR